MATSVDDVASMIASSERLNVLQPRVWQERASKFVVIALAVILLLPVLLTFAVLALFVARLFGVPISSSLPPDRRANSAVRRAF